MSSLTSTTTSDSPSISMSHRTSPSATPTELINKSLQNGGTWEVRLTIKKILVCLGLLLRLFLKTVIKFVLMLDWHIISQCAKPINFVFSVIHGASLVLGTILATCASYGV